MTSGSGGGFWQPDGGDPCAVDASSDGPDPPETPCDPASEAGACDLPPSVCAGAKWLIYYTNPRCESGLCRWDKKATECPYCDCMNGGCTMNITK